MAWGSELDVVVVTAADDGADGPSLLASYLAGYAIKGCVYSEGGGDRHVVDPLGHEVSSRRRIHAVKHEPELHMTAVWCAGVSRGRTSKACGSGRELSLSPGQTGGGDGT